MELKNFNVFFFMAILLGASVMVFFIFKPFFIALLLAIILAALFQKPYSFFLAKTGNSRRLSSLITSLIILLLIIIPVAMASMLVGNEIVSSYQSANGSGDLYQNYISPFFDKMQSNSVLRSFGIDSIFSKKIFAQYSSQIGQLILVFLQNAYLSAANVIFMIFVMFFSLYYFFIDGKDIVKKIMYVSPLKDSHENLLVQKFVSISRATIKGNLLVAIIQGTMGAILFAVVGMKSYVIWGIVMMFFSLLPLMGTALVWFPIGIIMLMLGNIWQGVVVLTVGSVLISSIDNVLRPKFIGQDTQLHPLLLFLAILGGLSLFGFAGFIVGPVVIALFVSLWDIYGIEFKNQLKKYNS